VLGLLLLMAVIYISSTNQVTSRQDDANQARRDARAAEAQAGQLTAYGDFSTAAETRTTSVKALAGGRFDWERFTRELSRVLPAGTWLTEVDASARPEDNQGTPATGSQAAPSGPSAKLTGCAKRQPDVATFMVRLRQLNRVNDVRLKESSRSTDTTSSTGSSSSGTATQGCGKAYTFDMTVLFDPAPAADRVAGGRKVPASLGGGQ
jgi:Tfp pilus assembly protein PilN